MLKAGNNSFRESFRWWAPTLLGMYVMTVGTYLPRYVITDQIRKSGWDVVSRRH